MIGKNSFFYRGAVAETHGRRLIFFATLVAVFVASVYSFQPAAAGARSEVVPTATPSPRKIRPVAVGDVNGDGMDPGVRSAPSSTGTNRSRSIKRKNQDIEVENDETHRAGNAGTNGVGSLNRATEIRSTPRKTRTETVDKNETITRSQPGHTSGNKSVRTSTHNKAPRTNVNRGRPATKRK